MSCQPCESTTGGSHLAKGQGRCVLALTLACLVLVCHRDAAAAPGQLQDGAGLIGEANLAVAAGNAKLAKELVARALAGGVAAQDLAESRRILGIAEFLLGDRAAAETAFLAFLEADIDGRLDPAVVPPEVILYFEDVRSRHGAALRMRRPKPAARRYLLMNFVPPLGQWQNGERTKAYLVGGAEAALLATSMATFFVLRSWCDRPDGTCTSGGQDRTESARALQGINLLSAAAFLGIYVYGVLDGLRGYRRPIQGSRVVGRTASGGTSLALEIRF